MRAKAGSKRQGCSMNKDAYLFGPRYLPEHGKKIVANDSIVLAAPIDCFATALLWTEVIAKLFVHKNVGAMKAWSRRM